jgi:hypothetical protein
MKKPRMYLFNTILWYAVAAMWTVTMVFRLTEDEKNYFLLFITGFTLLASLACAIINHNRYLKEKNAPPAENAPDTEE